MAENQENPNNYDELLKEAIDYASKFHKIPLPPYFVKSLLDLVLWVDKNHPEDKEKWYSLIYKKMGIVKRSYNAWDRNQLKVLNKKYSEMIEQAKREIEENKAKQLEIKQKMEELEKSSNDNI